jgi:hypothetical protein
VPNVSGFICSRIEIDNLRGCAVLGMGEQQQLDPGCVAAEYGKLDAVVVGRGAQGQRLAGFYR